MKGTRRSLYVNDLHGERSISEIPCRVSNIARDNGDIVPTTGSNRWSPHDVSCRDVTGNTEGKIRSNSDPRNDSEVESLWMEPQGFIRRRPWSLPMDLNSYISGYVDGEGCFCVSFQPSDRHRFGWEVRPSFSVSQNAERSEVLYLIRDRWKCGFIRPDRSDKTLKFEVRNIGDLVAMVLPHFRAFSADVIQTSRLREIRKNLRAG